MSDDDEKRTALESAGWVSGDAEDFLELSEDEREMVEEAVANHKNKTASPRLAEILAGLHPDRWLAISFHMQLEINAGSKLIGEFVDEQLGVREQRPRMQCRQGRNCSVPGRTPGDPV